MRTQHRTNVWPRALADPPEGEDGQAAVAQLHRAQGLGRLLGAEEVAAVLGVRASFVYALARRGELPTVRIGERYVRFRGEALERWIEAQESTRPKGSR